MVEVYREERTVSDAKLICSTFLCDHFHNYVLVVTALGDAVEYKISKLTKKQEIDDIMATEQT